MDITTRLTHLDEMVREAKAMPLSSSVLASKKYWLSQLNSLPCEPLTSVGALTGVS